MKLDKLSFLLLMLSLSTNVFWWIGDLIDPVNTYNLFFLRPEKAQKLHWYFHLTGFKIQSICLYIVILRYMGKKADRVCSIIIKTLLGFACIRLLEYWATRYETPILPLLLGIFITSIILYFRNGR